MKIIEWLLELLAWLQIFISPVIIGVILAGIIWLSTSTTWGMIVAIVIAVLGCGIGIAFAEKVRRNKGVIEFMARNISHPELREKENKQ